MNATQNLALYCASAVLEDFPVGEYTAPLPLAGERSANTTGTTLTATVEPWRKLTYINMWMSEKFDEATQQAFASSMSVPTWDLRVPDFDPKSRSIVTMAAGPQFIIAPNHLPLPEGIQGVREWVYHLPLRTAERVMKLVNEESQDWLLDVNQTSNQLSHLYTTCAWGSRSRHPEPQVNAPSKIKTHLLFVIQSPWLLSPADFKLFCERSMYRHYAKKNPKTGKVEVTQLDYVDKLWATIYDDCVRGDTHYFVLTTYNEWAFGAFSRGWTTAWITPPKPYNAGSPSVPGPTILQSILFWMHSAQQFAYTDQRTAKSHSIFAREGLDGELENPSRATSPFESDFESETDDNTLDKSWLNEMRSSMRAIKDIKGVQRLSANGSWVIPEVSADYVPWQTYETEFRERAGAEVEVGVKDEDTKSPGELYRREPERNKRTTATRRYSPISRPQIWEDMEPPRLPPKRTRPMDPIYDDEGPETPIDGQDDWLYKRQRPINDEHVTRRKPPTRQAERRQPPRPRGRPAAVATSNSSLFAAASKSASSASTRILPGGLPSHTSTGDSEPTWSPWASESSPVKIFWTRAFMSVRSTLADAFRKLVRSRSQKALPAPTMLFDASPRGRVSPIEPVAQPPMRQLPASQPPVQQQPAQLLPAHAFAALSVEEDDLEEVEVDQENMYAAGLSARDMPQTTIALGGHTIQLTPPTSRPRLLSGIHLDIPGDNTWPPRRPLRSITGHAPTESDSTEIDPDAQRRPEFGFRDTTPSIHANSLYNV